MCVCAYAGVHLYECVHVCTCVCVRMRALGVRPAAAHASPACARSRCRPRRLRRTHCHCHCPPHTSSAYLVPRVCITSMYASSVPRYPGTRASSGHCALMGAAGRAVCAAPTDEGA